MYPTADGIKFRFGEDVEIADFSKTARVRGKVKGLDCYVVLFPASCSDSTLSNITIRFGFPNRHLELEWGKFSGYKNEYILPAFGMKRSVI